MDRYEGYSDTVLLFPSSFEMDRLHEELTTRYYLTLSFSRPLDSRNRANQRRTGRLLVAFTPYTSLIYRKLKTTELTLNNYTNIIYVTVLFLFESECKIIN